MNKTTETKEDSTNQPSHYSHQELDNVSFDKYYPGQKVNI